MLNSVCVLGEYRTGVCRGFTLSYQCKPCDNIDCGEATYRTGTCTDAGNDFVCEAQPVRWPHTTDVASSFCVGCGGRWRARVRECARVCARARAHVVAGGSDCGKHMPTCRLAPHSRVGLSVRSKEASLHLSNRICGFVFRVPYRCCFRRFHIAHARSLRCVCESRCAIPSKAFA